VGLSGELFVQLPHDVPVGLVDRYFRGLSIPYVTSDNAAGGFQATDYLLRRGHRRIGVLQGLAHTSVNEDRLMGYHQALRRYGVSDDPSLIAGDSFSQASGYESTKQLLSRHPDISALFAFSNVMALGALNALAEAGLGVPRDISLLCFDDHPYAAHLATPLTAVAQSLTHIGQKATACLFQQLQASDEQPTGESVLLPTKLVERASVADITGA
jgi:LacI family transcriptional regulator